MSILEVNNVSKSFGGVKANVDISMAVEKGKIVGLMGPNGSGKTTLFNSIVGTYPIGYVPTIELNNVVFPDPFGPINPTIFPFSTAIDISTLALTPPKDLLTLFTSNILI